MPQTEEEHLENQCLDYEDHEVVKGSNDAEVSDSVTVLTLFTFGLLFFHIYLLFLENAFSFYTVLRKYFTFRT